MAVLRCCAVLAVVGEVSTMAVTPNFQVLHSPGVALLGLVVVLAGRGLPLLLLGQLL